MIRTFIGSSLIKLGMSILPSDVRKLVRNIVMFHVPGALTDSEKAEVIAAKKQW